MASDRDARAQHHQNLQQAKAAGKSLEKIADALVRLNQTLMETNAKLEVLKWSSGDTFQIPAKFERTTLTGDDLHLDEFKDDTTNCDYKKGEGL